MVKKSKRAARRARQKDRKRKLKQIEQEFEKKEDTLQTSLVQTNADIEYVPDVPDEDPRYIQYQAIFQQFAAPRKDENAEIADKEGDMNVDDAKGNESDDFDEEPTHMSQLSNKQRKKIQRLTVAKLKQTVQRPDLVELHDCNSHEPELLIQMKALVHSVPVPEHWSQKRKYLQGKRGFVKPPFKLPKFIEDTGISEIRQSQLNMDQHKRAKTRQREMMKPKMGKLDVNYQTLHDAFFRHQTKPDLAQQGELYFEGKEFQANVVKARPGVLSADLRTALGMGDMYPPPWLTNMQRFGPPPSYKNLSIAGLNAPIPPGCRYGYGEGEWGKPPVDQFGNPVYGDPFGVWVEKKGSNENVDNVHWGEIEDEEEEEILEEQPDEVDGDMDMEMDTTQDFSFIPPPPPPPPEPEDVAVSYETPDSFDIRKSSSSSERPLYREIRQEDRNIGTGERYGSSYTYDMSDRKT